jgi:hypothetical protein
MAHLEEHVRGASIPNKFCYVLDATLLSTFAVTRDSEIGRSATSLLALDREPIVSPNQVCSFCKEGLL